MSVRARRGDPLTSHLAGDSVDLTRGQHEVLFALREWGPMTDEQLLSRVSLSPSGARSRRAELTSMGLVIDTTRRAQSKANRTMIVWAAKGAYPNAAWRCLSCSATVLDEPPDTTLAENIRMGACGVCHQYVGHKRVS